MDVRQTAITLLYCASSIDPADIMLKSVYDTDNDGVVDKIKKLTDIEELESGYADGLVPKVNETGDAAWGVDESGGIDFDVVDGGTF